MRSGVGHLGSSEQLAAWSIARMLFRVERECVVSLHGFTKKTQMTPTQDIGPSLKREERNQVIKQKNIGSTFDSFLREEGVYEEVSAAAIKRVVARQVEAAMKEKGLTKSAMAREMHTSRAALDRLLDPDNDAVTLNTLQKAAAVVGRELRLELV